jgi:FkbM family methyltransferase
MKDLFNNRVRASQAGGILSRLSRPSALPAWLAVKFGVHKEMSAPLFFGESMRVVTGEVVSSQIISFGYTERALTALMLDRLKPDHTFVDVGTHFGYEAMLACKLVGTKGRVICFEPNPAAHPIAARNLSRFSQAELRQEGVSDVAGVLYVEELDENSSAFARLTETGEMPVPVVALDDALSGSVDFLKVDVEGMEAKVVAGAGRVLREHRPVVVLEADMPDDGNPSPRATALAHLMAGYGYEAFSFDHADALKVGPLGSFPTHHANILFLPR